MILAAHSFFLKHDQKQLGRMTPYSPLATLICIAILREHGHAVAHFDPTFSDGLPEFEAALDRIQPSFVAIMEDDLPDPGSAGTVVPGASLTGGGDACWVGVAAAFAR